MVSFTEQRTCAKVSVAEQREASQPAPGAARRPPVPLPCLTPTEGCYGPAGAPKRQLRKPTGEAKSLPNKSHYSPRSATHHRQLLRRMSTHRLPSAPLPAQGQMAPGAPEQRGWTGLRLRRGPAGQPGSSRSGTAAPRWRGATRRLPRARSTAASQLGPRRPARHRAHGERSRPPPLGGTLLPTRLPTAAGPATGRRAPTYSSGSWASADVPVPPRATQRRA